MLYKFKIDVKQGKLFTISTKHLARDIKQDLFPNFFKKGFEDKDKAKHPSVVENNRLRDIF